MLRDQHRAAVATVAQAAEMVGATVAYYDIHTKSGAVVARQHGVQMIPALCILGEGALLVPVLTGPELYELDAVLLSAERGLRATRIRGDDDPACRTKEKGE